MPRADVLHFWIYGQYDCILLGLSTFLTALSPKQSILSLCQCSAVTHVQSNISLIDFWAFVQQKAQWLFLLSTTLKKDSKRKVKGGVDAEL